MAFFKHYQEINIIIHKLGPIAYGKERMFYLTKVFFRLQNSPILQNKKIRKNIIIKCNEFIADPLYPLLSPTLKRLINNLIQK